MSRAPGILTLRVLQRPLQSLVRALPTWFPSMSCSTSRAAGLRPQIRSSAERHARLWGRSRDTLCGVGDWLERPESQPSSWRTPPSERLYLVELRQLRGASDVSRWAAQSRQRQCRGPETARHSTVLCGFPCTVLQYRPRHAAIGQIHQSWAN